MPTIKKSMQEIVEANKTNDWSAFDSMADEDAAKAASSDPDATHLSDQKLKTARRVSFVKHLRIQLGLTQDEFSQRYHIPLGTLRDWEQHRTEPDRAARAYLKVIAADPEHAARVLAG